MPPTTRVIGVGTTDVPIETIRTLHTELAAVGLPVGAGEARDTPGFGTDTQARVREFQRRYGLRDTGDVDPGTGGVMSLSALVATQSDRSQLREKLKSALNDVPDSPEYNYWLARYAILGGDYVTATTAIHRVHDFRDLGDLITIIDPGPQPQQPEVPYPENFYSYREDLIDPGLLAQLRSQLDSVTLDQYSAYVGRTVGAADFHLHKAGSALDAIAAWQTGNRHAANQEYTLAMQSYRNCQSFVAAYFAADGQLPGDSAAERIESLLAWRRQNEGQNAAFWAVLRWRRILLSLKELEAENRQKIIGSDGAFASPVAFIAKFMAEEEFGDPRFPGAANQAQRLDRLMVVMATVWVPLAIAELNCQLRQFEAAITGLSDLLASQASVEVRFRYLCEFIEVPFIRLLTLEALLGKADTQYKQGVTEFDTSKFPDSAIYHGQLAAQTYEQVMSGIAEDSHQYAAYVKQGRDLLLASIQDALVHKDTTSLAFRTLGKQLTVPTVKAATTAVPGLDRTLGPHQSIAKITAPDGRDTNPRIYAMGLLATAKLEQIRIGFNYLGYPSDYVPPWRFSFLLDRARYFAEHAKNAQRDYLNFLSNAEREEFQEQSASQNVEMEKSNVLIETAKVDLASAEVAAAQAAADGAALHARHAKEAADEYFDFELQANDADAWAALGSMFGDQVKIGEGLLSGNPLDVIGGALGLINTTKGFSVKQASRDLEWHNLVRTEAEANAAAAEALKKLDVARSALVVAGLQRQAAILRHEFAVQNLNYLRNRALNADQWFRLANGIRSVSDTYLRYAIELAFLAQHAYEFESDRLVDVIRFDYDVSALGSMLAADFLLRDLDTLEQDLIVSQRTRQQQVRYVVSMAREFPEGLRVLGDTGEVMFSMRLEQLERHFRGLFNLRISSVELLPVALMDPTRVSLELTHLGVGMIRFKAQPGTSPLNSSDLAANEDWLANVGASWPVKVHVSGPQTAVFSGLSRQEAAGLGMIATNERVAFDGLPGASSWRIDMSMKENQVVPGTLADVLITFTLTGFYDAGLDQTVGDAVASVKQPFATTSFISARRALPDAYYSLVHYGKLDWTVSERMLSLAGTPNELRNLAVVLPLAQNGVELGRCYCRYPIRLPNLVPGPVEPLTILPRFTMTSTGLTLNCAFTGPAGTEVTWDFGDNTPIAQGPTAQHAYARPGRYEVLARLAKDGKLVEYRSAVVISANHPVVAPLIVTPTFSASPIAPDGTVALTVSLPPATTDISIECSAGRVRGSGDTGPVTLRLKPGFEYGLDFLATRKLSARFYSKQRYLATVPVSLSRLRVSTNRTFDPSTGMSTTTSPNAFTTHLFASGNITISPVDRWTLELPLVDNPCFMSVSPSDVAEFDGGELSDAVLSLEFLGSK